LSEAGDNWIAVGRLIRPRGNRGELIAEIYSSQPGRAEKLRSVALESPKQRQVLEIEQVWFHDGKPIFKFKGVDSIDDAAEWAGADMLVPESERALPEPGEYSHADLIGCALVTDRTIGVVTGVEEFGGPPLLKLRTEDGRDILVPFARTFCREIDIEHKVIRAELPEGLLELP
jgi:16S rRNA processing protein RimM